MKLIAELGSMGFTSSFQRTSSSILTLPGQVSIEQEHDSEGCKMGNSYSKTYWQRSMLRLAHIIEFF